MVSRIKPIVKDIKANSIKPDARIAEGTLYTKSYLKYSIIGGIPKTSEAIKNNDAKMLKN